MFHRSSGHKRLTMERKTHQNEFLRRRVRLLLQKLRELDTRRMKSEVRAAARKRVWAEIHESFAFWEWEDPG